MIHVVAPGESLSDIAASHGISEQLLMQENGLLRADTPVPGQALLVLIPQQTYTVQAGDTLYAIARQYRLSLNYLYRLNPWLGGLPDIFPGELLVLEYTEQARGALLLSGYAYPSITGAQLRRILPGLSALLPFSWGFTAQGQLLPLEDAEMRQLAQEYGVATLLVLTPQGADGRFDNQLITDLFADEAARQQLLAQLTVTVAENNYAGVDLDFEYVREEDAAAYVAFAAELALILHKQGRILSVALAPKYYAEQQGLLYEGHDYYELGRVADLLLMMTYEWGYTYGPPQAVSPLYEVERVVDYALSEIPAGQLLLGMSNYGYDWTLPYQPGRAAISLSPQRAVELARENKAAIQYDAQAQAPWFNYTDTDGLQHVVWFEDVRSIQARLLLAQSKKLRGVSYWTLNRAFPANWLLLAVTAHPEPFPAAPG